MWVPAAPPLIVSRWCQHDDRLPRAGAAHRCRTPGARAPPALRLVGASRPVVTRPGESRVLAEAREFRALVLARDSAMLRRLIHGYRPVMATLTANIDSVAAAIRRRAAEGMPVTPGSIVRLGEYQDMVRQLREALATYSTDAGRIITAQQLQHVQQAVTDTQALVGAQLPAGMSFDALAALGARWAVVDADALEVLVGAMRDGSSLNTYLRSQLVQGTVDGLADKLTAGLVQNPRATAATIRQQLLGGQQQALRVARTETLRAYREASRAQYEQNDRMIRGYRRMASLDDRTCAACWIMDGVLYHSDSDLDEHVQGRCFTVPELVPLSELLGMRVDEPEPIVAYADTGRARFRAMDEDEQRAIVRNDRLYDQYAAGRIPLNGLIQVHRDPVWGQQVTTNTAARAQQRQYAPRLPGHDGYWGAR